MWRYLGGFEPFSCSLKGLRANMKISNFDRKYSPGYRHVICIGKTKSASEGLLFSIQDELHFRKIVMYEGSINL